MKIAKMMFVVVGPKNQGVYRGNGRHETNRWFVLELCHNLGALLWLAAPIIRKSVIRPATLGSTYGANARTFNNYQNTFCTEGITYIQTPKER